MALHPLRLRRALSRSYALLERSFHGCKAEPISSVYAARLLPTPAATAQLMRRPFTSTTALFRKAFNPETDEIGPDTILFEGCDYNHWLITVDFPKDSIFTREQMIDTYVNIAAQVFGSVEEAKKKIYALSTTTYQGFQVECSEETSEKFKSIPQVVFVLPDSYIDPVNKEYGGDKYVNGDIFPRPPPIHYGRRVNRDRHPREQNYSPPPQQNYGPPPHQNNRPSPQHNYGPPPQQSNRPSPQQNYGQPPQPSQQNYGQPHQQNSGQPLHPTYVQPPPQNYGQPPQQNNWQSPQQKYGPSPYQKDASPQQQNYRPPQQHQSYGPPPQQGYMPNTQGSYGNSPNFPTYPNNSPAGSGERSGYMRSSNTPERDERDSVPSYQGNFNRAELDYSAQGQGKFESHPRPGQRGSPQDANYGFSQDGALGQMSGGYRNFSSSENN